MSKSSFRHPPENRFFEDYVPGAVHEFGSVLVDEEEVLDFGRRYVPLSYHIDKEAAQDSIYGGLIASGWHTAALMMRLYTDNYLSKIANWVRPDATQFAGTNRFFPATGCQCG
jgi:acyl dehydratase